MTNRTFLIFLTLYAMIHLSTECLPETPLKKAVAIMLLAVCYYLLRKKPQGFQYLSSEIWDWT